MARHPEWFARLDAIEESLRGSAAESLGRNEIGALFKVSDRDALRLLHRFGAERRADALSLPRSGLLAQLGAVRRGAAFEAFRRQREGVAQHLTRAREEARARQFRVPGPATPSAEDRAGFEALPETIRWQRTEARCPARFEIQYDNGEDLLWQLAQFLRAATQNRAEFFRGTEPGEETS